MGAGQLPLASPKLALHRALQYAVEFWPYVMNVLEDGAPGALEQRRLFCFNVCSTGSAVFFRSVG